jgi:hypothetical protein
MKTFISRTAFAALLATSMGAGLVALTPAAALAQMSPANPNFSWDSRGGTGIYAASNGNAAYAQAPVAHTRFQSGLSAQDTVVANGSYLGQDPDANVRLQLRRDEGLFDR